MRETDHIKICLKNEGEMIAPKRKNHNDLHIANKDIREKVTI